MTTKIFKIVELDLLDLVNFIYENFGVMPENLFILANTSFQYSGLDIDKTRIIDTLNVIMQYPMYVAVLTIEQEVCYLTLNTDGHAKICEIWLDTNGELQQPYTDTELAEIKTSIIKTVYSKEFTEKTSSIDPEEISTILNNYSISDILVLVNWRYHNCNDVGIVFDSKNDIEKAWPISQNKAWINCACIVSPKAIKFCAMLDKKNSKGIRHIDLTEFISEDDGYEEIDDADMSNPKVRKSIEEYSNQLCCKTIFEGRL